MTGAAIAMIGSLASGPQAPIAVGTGAATMSTLGSLPLTITTSAPVPLGGWISVWASAITGGTPNFQSATPTSCTDQVGNTYAIQSTAGGTAFTPGLVQFVCQGAATTLPSGDTITVTYNSAGSTASGFAAQAAASTIPGVAALDLTSTGAHATSSTPSISTGTLNFAAEIVQVATTLESGGSDTWTEGAGFTTLQTVTGTNALRIAYVKTTTTVSQTYSPTNSASKIWAISFATFN